MREWHFIKKDKKDHEKKVLLEKVKIAAKKLKREHRGFSTIKINNSKRIKKINSKREKNPAQYKLQIKLSCFRSIIF